MRPAEERTVEREPPRPIAAGSPPAPNYDVTGGRVVAADDGARGFVHLYYLLRKAHIYHLISAPKTHDY